MSLAFLQAKQIPHTSYLGLFWCQYLFYEAWPSNKICKSRYSWTVQQLNFRLPVCDRATLLRTKFVTHSKKKPWRRLWFQYSQFNSKGRNGPNGQCGL